jgi:hypothetical protein
MFQAKTGERTFPAVPDTGALCTPTEPRAPLALLSPAKRSALITCLNGGGTLHKRCGVWLSESSGTERPVSGMTVADLGRDGMLTLTVLGKNASAQLTPRGNWFARTAAAEIESTAKR